MKKVSVIVPVYNDEKYLAKNIESILCQPVQDMELIYILDGCTDRSEDIVTQYQKRDKRIKILKQTNKGQGAARNAGLEIATGKYILFVDSDDYLESDSINSMIQLADKNELDLLQGFFRFVDENGNEIKNWCPENKKEDKIYTGIEMLQLNKASCTVCLCLISHKLIKEHQIRFVEGLVHEDVDFFSRMFYYAKRVKIFYYAYYSRTIRPGSTMTSHNMKKYIDLCKIAKIVTEFVENEVDEKTRSIFFDNWIVFLYSNIVHTYICKGDSLRKLFSNRELADDILCGLKRSSKIKYKVQYLMLKWRLYHLYEILYFGRAKFKIKKMINNN